MASKEELSVIKDSQALIKAKQAEFRSNVQDIVNNNMGRMQEILDTLDPKEFCDVLIKLIPYGYARVPEEKPKETTPQDLVVEKTVMRQKLLSDE